jgi:hypothetical protein
MKRWKVALSLAVIAAIAVPSLAGTWQLAPGKWVALTEDKHDFWEELRLTSCLDIHRDNPDWIRDCQTDREKLRDRVAIGGYWSPPPEEVTSKYVVRNLTVAASAFGLAFALVMVIPVIARRYSAKRESARTHVGPAVEAGKGVSHSKIAKELGVSEHTVENARHYEKGKQEGVEDAIGLAASEALSLSEKQKLDAAIRAHNARRMQENREHWKHHFPKMEEQQNKAYEREMLFRKFLDQQKKIFTVDQFKLILVCLHPDGDRSPEKRADAFQLFNAKRFALTGEVDKKNGTIEGKSSADVAGTGE